MPPTGARYDALDSLRGLALLGILVMNIQAFAMIAPAYINPTAYGDLTGANLLVWLLGHVFAEQKFISLFALLFGAGIALAAEREEAAGRPAFDRHGRRMGWLLVFGLLHGYLLWYGDILFSYAVCALLVYPAWRWPVRRLLVAGAVCLSVPSLLLLGEGLTAPAATAAYGAFWQPSAAAVAAEEAAYRGGWWVQLQHRVPMMSLLIVSLPLEGLWRISGLMLLGMALYRSGMLIGAWPAAAYRRLAAAGLALGLPLILLGVVRNFAHDWAPGYAIYFGSQYNYWGSIAVALAYAGLVVLWCRSGGWAWARRALAAVGRLALSNYLLQTLICTSLFYGHGLGLFGQLQRAEQFLVVLAIWPLQIAFSLLWLRRYRQGPLEALWRTLSQGRRRPSPP